MQGKYTTKDMKKASTKSTKPKNDGEIFKDGNTWKFKWKGSECGYATEADAKKGLLKVSGKIKTKT